MSEHTRTTRDVEFFFVAGMTTAGTRPHIARVEFRDYLAAHDAQVRAEAWDEGEEAGRHNAVNDLRIITRTSEPDTHKSNPYRIEQEGAGQ